MFSLIFDTEYVDPQDLLDTIIDGISIIKIDNSQKAYLEQLIEFFCKCRKYNMAMKTLNCINSFEMNFYSNTLPEMRRKAPGFIHGDESRGFLVI